MGVFSFPATDDGVVDQKEDDDQNGQEEEIVVEQAGWVWGRRATRCGVVIVEVGGVGCGGCGEGGRFS